MKAYYTGILCPSHKMNVPEDLDFLISISGPEPQRSKLEEILLCQVQKLPGEKMVLLGRPHDNFEKKLDRNERDGGNFRKNVTLWGKTSLTQRGISGNG